MEFINTYTGVVWHSGHIGVLMNYILAELYAFVMHLNGLDFYHVERVYCLVFKLI